jgi:hypothetical protein
MRIGFKLTALAVAFISLAFWFFGGPNLGWSTTSGTEWMIDPVTGQESSHLFSHVIPGLDFLAITWLAAAILYLFSFFFRKQQ